MQASEGPSEGGPPPKGAVESSKAIACHSILPKTNVEWCSLYCQTSLGVMKQMMRPWLWLGYSFRHQGRISNKSMSSIRSSFRSVIVKRVFASMHAWLSIGLFGSTWFIWLVGFSSRCLWVFLAVFLVLWLWFVCIPVRFSCVCECVESVCVLGVFCWLRWGHVYRVGPSRAQISDLHIPEPPLIASVCCSPQRNPCRISLGSIFPVFS